MALQVWVCGNSPSSRRRQKDHVLPLSGLSDAKLLGILLKDKDRLYACYFNKGSSPIGEVSHRSDSRHDLICIFGGGRLLCDVIVDNAFSIIK